MKKLFAIGMAAVLLTSAMPLSPLSVLAVEADTADESDETNKTLVDGNCQYYVNEDGKSVTVTQCESIDNVISVPNEIKGMPVTAISFFPEGTEKLMIPENVRHILKMEEEYCSGFCEVIIDEKNPYFSSLDGAVLNKDKTELIWVSNLGSGFRSYRIPDTVETIDSYAFATMGINGAIYIPKSIKKIDFFFAGAWCFECSEENAPTFIGYDGNEMTFAEYNAEYNYGSSKYYFGCIYDDHFIYRGTDALCVVEAWDSQAARYEVPEAVNGTPVTAIDANAQFSDGTHAFDVYLPVSIQTLSAVGDYNKETGEFESDTFYNNLSTLFSAFSFFDKRYLHYAGTREQWYAIKGVEAFECEPAYLAGLPNRDGLSDYDDSIQPNIFADGFVCTEYYDGIVINGVQTSQKRISIPETIHEKPVIGFKPTSHLSCEELHIPASLTSISDIWYIDVSKAYEVDAENPSYSSADGILYNKEQTAIIRIPQGITKLHIPASVTEIYADTYRIESYEVDKANPVYSSIDGVLYNKDQTIIIRIPDQMTKLHIPASVKTIEAALPAVRWLDVDAENTAFSAVDNVLYNKDQTVMILVPYTLEKIYIPASVTKIEDSVLNSLFNIYEIVVDPQNKAFCSVDNVLFNKAKTKILAAASGTLLKVPASVTEIAYNAMYYIRAVDVAKGNTVYSCQDGCLYNYDKTELLAAPFQNTNTTISIPASVQSISYNVLRGFKYQVDPANMAYSSENGVLFNKEKTEIVDLPHNLATLHIPATLTDKRELSYYDVQSYEADADSPYFSSIDGVLYNKDQSTLLAVPYGIKTLHIPASVTEMKTSAWSLSTIAEAFEVDPDNTAFCSEDGYLYSKDKSTLLAIPQKEIDTLHISSAVTSIGDAVFSNSYSIVNGFDVDADNTAYCSEDGVLYDKSKTIILGFPRGIAKLHIPATVTSISDDLKWSLNNIGDSFEVDADNPAFCSVDGILYNKEKTKLIAIPENAQKLHIPASVTGFQDYLYNNFDRLKDGFDVDEGNTVYSSVDGYLYNKDKTELIAIPSEGIETLNILASVKAIDSAVYYTLSVAEKPITITVDKDNTAFCVIDGALYSKSKDVLYRCNPQSKGAVTIPEQVDVIDRYAFFRCSGITEITLPASVKKIGYETFGNCENLNKITIQNPNCIIGDSRSFSEFTIYNCFDESVGKDIFKGTICGMQGSSAQDYAEYCGYRFAVIDSEKTETVSGDVNGDGEVNLKDAVLIRRYIVGGWNVELDEAVADVNGDGTVNLKDVVLLRRYIAGGWDVELNPKNT